MRFFLAFLILTFSLQLSAATTETSSLQVMANTSQLATSSTQKASKQKLSLKEKLAVSLIKRATKKAERRAAKRKGDATKSSFADIVVLAAAIVVIVGIITIISSPLHGLIVSGIGLVIYLLGKGAGGSLNNLF